MSKANKVCTNLQQDFNETEKQTARNNIDANKFKYVNGGGAYGPSYVTTDEVALSNTTNGIYVTPVSGSPELYGMFAPLTTSDGEHTTANQESVLSVTDPLTNTIAWRDTWHPSRDYTRNVQANTLLHTYERISSNHETFGTVTFSTDKAGSYSVVPLNITNQYLSKYATQCTNANNVGAGSVTLPFCFDTESRGVTDIGAIGIKGSSDTTGANVSIDDIIIMYRN
jgi:hypothetical protein